jgi:predicted RNase H-like nuclease (RuvC/YqgF family)
MSSSTSAGRSLRNTRRGPVAPAPATKEPKTPRTATTGKDTTDADAPTNVQELKDNIKELKDTKAQLESKVTQLEYLEANARLSASMLSKEIMDLKEKSRKLEIELCMSLIFYPTFSDVHLFYHDY